MATKVFDLRAKRTEGNPPRSLFGTVVEIKDPEALHEADNLELESKPQKPDKLARFRPQDADDRLEAAEQELNRQKHKVQFQNGRTKEAELNALYFEPSVETIAPGVPEGALTHVPKSTYSPYRTDIKLHSRDISLAEEYNKLGLTSERHFNGRQDYIVKKPGEYNYERYRVKPDNSRYKNSGNIFGEGGLLTSRGKDTATLEGKPSAKRLEASPVRSSPKKSGLCFQVPANIRHTHGSRLCDELMKDEERIKKALHLVPSTREKTTPGMSSSFVISHETDPMYTALGNALRADVFNGVSYGHLKSLNSASYTEDIPRKSTETFPPKFAKQRNEDSKWNEDNVIRQRMKKQWDEVVANKGKQDN